MTTIQAPTKHLIILGPQASGKGTQAAMLAQEFGLAHISMGEKLREEIASGSKLGQTLKGFMDKGELVPDEYTMKIALREIQNAQHGFIFDGFPRNTAQAKFLDEHTRIDRVIVLDLIDKVAIERIGGRRECPKGHTYHLKFKPPKKEGVCDLDGSSLFRRQDDDESVVRMRISTYKKETYPLVEHYQKKGVLQVVNGVQDEAHVTSAILLQVTC